MSEVPYFLIRELAKDKLSLSALSDDIRTLQGQLKNGQLPAGSPYAYLGPELRDGKVHFKFATSE